MIAFIIIVSNYKSSGQPFLENLTCPRKAFPETSIFSQTLCGMQSSSYKTCFYGHFLGFEEVKGIIILFFILTYIKLKTHKNHYILNPFITMGIEPETTSQRA